MMDENKGRSSYVIVVTKCDKVSGARVRNYAQHVRGRELKKKKTNVEKRQGDMKHNVPGGVAKIF